MTAPSDGGLSLPDFNHKIEAIQALRARCRDVWIGGAAAMTDAESWVMCIADLNDADEMYDGAVKPARLAREAAYDAAYRAYDRRQMTP